MKKMIEVPEGYEVKFVLSDENAEHPVGQWVYDSDRNMYACKINEREAIDVYGVSGESNRYDDISISGQNYQPVTNFNKLSKLLIKDAKRRYPEARSEWMELSFNRERELILIDGFNRDDKRTLFTPKKGWIGLNNIE